MVYRFSLFVFVWLEVPHEPRSLLAFSKWNIHCNIQAVYQDIQMPASTRDGEVTMQMIQWCPRNGEGSSAQQRAPLPFLYWKTELLPMEWGCTAVPKIFLLPPAILFNMT